MGKAAADFADVVIVTDDNPRSEDPGEIRTAVLKGCPEANEFGDRAEAILRGVDMLEAGDALLIAGKGHEAYQEIAGVRHDFSDADEIDKILDALEAAAESPS